MSWPLRVLHATDFSGASRQAFARALELGKQPRTKLFLLHVLMPPSQFLGNRLPSSYLELEARAQRDAARRIAAMMTKVRKAGIKNVESKLGTGAPAEQIIRQARRWRVDLIVMGTHGRSGVGRAFMGSVAERVLQRASCPVITVRGR
jgi:nucleotide-binding universal stress UspA family protein